MLAQKFFTHLFKKEGSATAPNGFPSFSEDLKQVIRKPFTKYEIKKALFDMVPYKALGIEGFHADFFQKT